MSGLLNFRDFGGMRTADGGRVRADRLYRCGHLASLSPLAIAEVTGLDFGTVADLRYARERQSQPSPWPADWVDRILSHDADRTRDAPHLAMLRNGTLTVEAVELFYRDLYATLPFAPPYRRLFAETIRRIGARGDRVLIHCTAGKDRTGIFCALLLDVLGVPRDASRADYLRSRDAEGLKAMVPRIIERTRARYGHVLDPHAVAALIDVKPAYLAATFDALEADGGSTTDYFQAGGVDCAMIDRLRAALVTA